MKNQKDQYNFSRPSTSGEAGFEVFQDKNNKLFYFHVNGEDGMILLYSQGYKTKKGRNNGIRSVIKNRRTRSRYHIAQEGDYKYYFVLKAGNSQEIARSNYFVSKQQIEKKLEYLMESSFAYTFVKKQKSTRSPIPKKRTSEKLSTTKSVTQKKKNKDQSLLNKHSFRIDIYHEGDVVAGKIEHLLSKEKTAFTNLDFTAIQDFMEVYILPTKKKVLSQESTPAASSFIPKKLEKPAISEKAKKLMIFNPSEMKMTSKEKWENIVNKSDQNISNSVILEKKAPPKKELQKNTFEYLFTSTAENKPATNFVNSKSAFNVNLKVPVHFLKDESDLYVKLKLQAQSLDQRIQTYIGEFGYRLFSEKENISIRVMPNTLIAGTYRLKLVMTNGVNDKHFKPMEGECYLRVF